MSAATHGYGHGPFDPEALGMPAVYTLNLSAAQRSILEWLTSQGAVFDPIAADVEQIAHDCGTSVSTVYESLARLESLNLVDHPDPGSYRINPRYFFSSNPEIRRLVGEALAAPEITPDARAEAPRKVGNTDARRRRTIKAVRDEE
ncbi:helix-turn-helix domain-containing protein [Kitasatospora sp. GP82]|uniref:helix-turn-helix domain-containing protein n=1 Tax=Kitasatospora sp. GP82 TaxID=3035089 RepID=UPI002472F0D7|nr:helix-turn-helix domain-containing protein [Kitasatospora sp. GP82]MDH6129291.1 DNA-binding IclR family transcriptional regulator [Kitasatospora sp. GP82]